jgi:hypothetical protein
MQNFLQLDDALPGLLDGAVTWDVSRLMAASELASTDGLSATYYFMKHPGSYDFQF